MSELPAEKQLASLLEAVKKEAHQEGFTAGYAKAMRQVRQFTGQAGKDVVVEVPSAQLTLSSAERAPRGHVANVVMRVLQTKTDRAMGPTEIARRAQNLFGEELALSSIRHSLNQLKSKGKVDQIDSNWRIAMGYRQRETAGTDDQANPAAPSTTTKEDHMDPP